MEAVAVVIFAIGGGLHLKMTGGGVNLREDTALFLAGGLFAPITIWEFRAHRKAKADWELREMDHDYKWLCKRNEQTEMEIREKKARRKREKELRKQRKKEEKRALQLHRRSSRTALGVEMVDVPQLPMSHPHHLLINADVDISSAEHDDHIEPSETSEISAGAESE